MKRKSRSRHLTREEVERDRKLRGLIEDEKPQINALIRRQMGEVRRAKEPGKEALS